METTRIPEAKRHCGPRSMVVVAAITFGETHAHAESDIRLELLLWSLLVPHSRVFCGSQPVHWAGKGSSETTHSPGVVGSCVATRPLKLAVYVGSRE